MREIVFNVVPTDPLNTGNGVVGFCQPGEKLLEIAPVCLDRQGAFRAIETSGKLF